MRSGISISVSAADRRRLEAIVADRNTPQKHVWRARIMLLTADGVGANAVWRRRARRRPPSGAGRSDSCKRGRRGFCRTRRAGNAPIEAARVDEVVRRTLAPPPHEATHWTARAMAEPCGLAVWTVQDLWKAHGLAPRRWRSFKLSTDPAFAEKPHDIVGLQRNSAGHVRISDADPELLFARGAEEGARRALTGRGRQLPPTAGPPPRGR
jgi:hypothetical protein